MKAPAGTAWLSESNRVFDEEVAQQLRFRDPASGIFPIRLTSEPCVSTNIYPEHPASTPDGRRFVFARRPALGGTFTFWIADVPTRRVRQITDEPEARAPVVMPDGRWLYYTVGAAIWRMSTETFEREPCFDLRADIGPVGGIRTVSADGTRFLTSCQPGPGRFGVAVVDIATRSARVVYEHGDARNPHEQYSRTPSRKVMIQVNDGIETDRDGNLVKLVGENGASLHVVNDDGTGHVKLPVGSSPLERVQGHQCWVGGRDMVITALHRRAGPSATWVQDRLVTVVPGEDSCRVVGEGPGFTHVHTSPDGRFWVADCNRTADIFVGTVDGGRMRRFCASGASFGAAQYTHPHPFFLGDGRSIGWNSDATGVPQVYCARIPDWFLESLLTG